MKQTLGHMIVRLRKEKGMTQVELAEKLGVTDKAVSKWKRDLNYPDIGTIPQLAEILNVSVDELLQGKSNTPNNTNIVNLILKSIALAMGIAIVVLLTMNQIEVTNAISMLAIGLICLTLNEFNWWCFISAIL
ncbi:MAG: helix-turn-helix domain-containing protein [Erysipelotrichaceae bacterium]|nr:helix-turn-helix domain-containing protein [Erysipelotrichaceae bacterium]